MREDMRLLCEKLNVPFRVLPRSIATRWNSTSEQIDCALDMQQVLTRLVTQEKYNTSRSAKLKRFALSQPEWELLRQLNPLLLQFRQCTLRISQSAIPLIHEVIPLIDVLTHSLDTFISKSSFHPAVRAAAARGKVVLNKYYQMSDSSIIYCCAMMLHPRYKTAYFARQEWPTEWITNAVYLLRSHWITYYKPKVDLRTSCSGTIAGGSEDFFSAVDTWDATSSGDALDDYLSAPSLSSVTNPIVWWISFGGDGPLRRMALDFLSVPASSVDVERAFSRGGLTVSKLRHRLSAESVRASTVLNSWMKHADLIPETQIINAFTDKKKVRRSRVGTDSEVQGTSDDDLIIE